jgi:hypothetical protein
MDIGSYSSNVLCKPQSLIQIVSEGTNSKGRAAPCLPGRLQTTDSCLKSSLEERVGEFRLDRSKPWIR